jgi:hypothetical protein
MSDPTELGAILRRAAEHAANEAQITLNAVRERMGLINLDALPILS